jgi:vacuolar-type H+-ATPase subunit I/STV1
MSDQFKRQKITREIARIKNEAHARAIQERDSLKKRAEKAEAELDNEKDHSKWADDHIEFLKSELDKAEAEINRLQEILAKRKRRQTMSNDFKVWRAIAISTIAGAFIWATVIYLGWRISQ